MHGNTYWWFDHDVFKETYKRLKKQTNNIICVENIYRPLYNVTIFQNDFQSGLFTFSKSFNNI